MRCRGGWIFSGSQLALHTCCLQHYIRVCKPSPPQRPRSSEEESVRRKRFAPWHALESSGRNAIANDVEGTQTVTERRVPNRTRARPRGGKGECMCATRTYNLPASCCGRESQSTRFPVPFMRKDSLVTHPIAVPPSSRAYSRVSPSLALLV